MLVHHRPTKCWCFVLAHSAEMLTIERFFCSLGSHDGFVSSGMLHLQLDFLQLSRTPCQPHLTTADVRPHVGLSCSLWHQNLSARRLLTLAWRLPVVAEVVARSAPTRLPAWRACISRSRVPPIAWITCSVVPVSAILRRSLCQPCASTTTIKRQCAG